MTLSLPSSAPFVKLHALLTGRLQLPERWLFEDGDDDVHRKREDSPVFSFLIEHTSGKRVLFDLGLRKDLENNPAIIVQDYPAISPFINQDAVELLASGYIDSSQIDAVIFSHLHFDHTGDCTKFPNAKIIAGPGSSAFTKPGFPKSPNSPFFSDILDHPHFQELELKPESTVAPFTHAHDFFGDGSLYLVDAPGHMPGHLAAIAHTGEEEWVFMGGDCCHHRALLQNQRPMSVTVGPNGTKSFHANPAMAKQTIEKVRMLEQHKSVFVALPHDATLDGYMPLFPNSLNGWKGSSWKESLDKHVASIYNS